MPALASQPVRKPSQSSDDIYGGKLSVARVGAAVALLLVTLAIACAQNNSNGLVARSAPSPGEFSLDMPLP